MGERIATEKVINFGKSSGGKEEASHLRKLDTSKEIPEKIYVQEKFSPRLNTITKAEFERRKASFEAWRDKVNEARGRRVKKWTKVQEGKKRSESFCRKFRSLENLWRGDCREKELEMSRKLGEIHELVQKMQKLAKMGERKDKAGGKALPDWRSKARETRAPGPSTFESRCNLSRKMIPIQFSTSFLTELGSRRKSFSEKILFKSVFVPSGDEEKRKVYRSTLEISCRPETEIKVKPYRRL